MSCRRTHLNIIIAKMFKIVLLKRKAIAIEVNLLFLKYISPFVVQFENFS